MFEQACDSDRQPPKKKTSFVTGSTATHPNAREPRCAVGSSMRRVAPRFREVGVRISFHSLLLR